MRSLSRCTTAKVEMLTKEKFRSSMCFMQDKNHEIDQKSYEVNLLYENAVKEYAKEDLA